MRISLAAVVNPILMEGPTGVSAGVAPTCLAGSTGSVLTACGGLAESGVDGIFGAGRFAGSDFFAEAVGAGRGRGFLTLALCPPQATENEKSAMNKHNHGTLVH